MQFKRNSGNQVLFAIDAVLAYSVAFGLLLSLLFCSTVVCTDYVLELSAANFKSTIEAQGRHTLVMFYAPWCGHCQEAKPKFSAAASKIELLKGNKKLAQLDCDQDAHRDICKQNNIDGYPTIKLFYEGILVQTYAGMNEIDDFVQYMTKPPLPGEVKEDAEPEQTADTYMPEVVYFDAANFSTGIKAKQHTLVFFYAPWCPHCVEAKPQYQAAAAKIANSPTRCLAAVNCDKPENHVLCETENVEGFPTIRYYRDGVVWAEYMDDVKEKSFIEYIGKPPIEKQEIAKLSQEVDKQKEDPSTPMKHVLELTAETFSKEVGKANRHTLVMFHAPWCGHCIMAKPKVDAAAEALLANAEASADRRIAAIDCDAPGSATICDKEGVEGFPTLALYRNGLKTVLFPHSPPTKENVLDFMLKLEKVTASHEEL